MKNREQWISLNIKELETEVEIREDLLMQLGGALYQGIVSEEIYDLKCAISTIKYAERKAQE